MKSTTSRGGSEADCVSGDFHLHCYRIIIYDFIYILLFTFDTFIMILKVGYMNSKEYCTEALRSKCVLLLVNYSTIPTFDCVITILCLHNNDNDGQVDVNENLVLAR